MQQTPHQRKTLTERVIHAITFEGLATLILAPTAAWLMQRSVVEMGGLSILLATLAMVWNIIYNAAFDRLWQKVGATFLTLYVLAAFIGIGHIPGVIQRFRANGYIIREEAC